MNRKLIVNLLKDTISQATGSEWDLKVVKNEKYDTEKWADHYRRQGFAVIETDAKSGRGVRDFSQAVRKLLEGKKLFR